MAYQDEHEVAQIADPVTSITRVSFSDDSCRDLNHALSRNESAAVEAHLGGRHASGTAAVGGSDIVDFTQTLESMRAEQYVLAFVFLSSYAFALGRFIGTRGRLVASAVALASAVGFAAFSNPWEDGVMVAALALIGMGLFSATVWTLWAAARWQHRRVARSAP